MKNVVGPNIRAARNRSNRKVSQAELAARLQAMGVSLDPSAISRIENRERSISDIEILAICRALDISVTSVFGDV